MENELISIQAAFGKVTVDIERPRITALWLRNPDGSLSSDSILSKLVNGKIIGCADGSDRRDSIAFANGAYTYVVDSGGKRYESTSSRVHKVEVTRDKDGQVVKLAFIGIQLLSRDDPQAAVTEDWDICLSGGGSELLWRISQYWQRDIDVSLSGTPALFLGPFGGWQHESNLALTSNCVTSTLWYDPQKMNGNTYGPPYLCEAGLETEMVSADVCQTINVRDTWAVYKLFTNMHIKADVQMGVSGGYLYRRGGNWGAFNEIGSTIADDIAYKKKKGDMEQLELRLMPLDKFDTGHQLDIAIPDKGLESSLKDMYESVLNGGSIAYQKEYFFGNQSEGCSHIGASQIFGYPVSVGIPARSKISEHPYDPGRAFGGLLQAMFDSVGSDNTAKFSFNKYLIDKYGDTWAFDAVNLYVIASVGIHYLHTGDASIVRDNLPIMEQMIRKLINNIDQRKGLYFDPRKEAHWYYDNVKFEGYSTFNNVLLYKAVSDMAEMEKLVGSLNKSQNYRVVAERLKKAINEVLWMEDAPGGPRYSDWTTSNGKQMSYFADMVQYPAIVYGVASKEQAKKIIATADKRMAELERDYGFAGHASPSFLWDNSHVGEGGGFGYYMNGGTLLWITYYEVVARCIAGDSKGAYNRLKNFCRGYDRQSWVGNNAANIKGEMYHSIEKLQSGFLNKTGDGEPYLADFVAVAASVIHGIMGIVPGWDSFNVSPCLPEEWEGATASILYKGVRTKVTIRGGEVKVTAE